MTSENTNAAALTTTAAANPSPSPKRRRSFLDKTAGRFAKTPLSLTWTIFTGSLLVALILALTTCINNNSNIISGQPDQLGSWGQINQNIGKSDDWQQIVTDSQFQLGEKIYRGSWQEGGGMVDIYTINFGTYPYIDGSTVAVPMALEFAWQHLGLEDEDYNFVYFSTTHYAYLNLINREGFGVGSIWSERAFVDENQAVDLIIVTEPSEEERAIAAQKGVTLVMEPVCFDAFVFITHKDNPVDSLTIDQVRGIYSGRIKNWKQVGGNDEAIVAYQREEKSGSQTAMINMVMGDTPMIKAETVDVAMGMGMLVEMIAEYQNGPMSIGYTYKYYIDTLYKADDIKVLRIDGVAPSAENMRNLSYPLTTNYYGVIRGGEEKMVGGLFLEWMISPEGQRCIEQAGYVALYDPR